jgi:dipeptidyl aminopeptidase/acylaminoacyl peptidase
VWTPDGRRIAWGAFRNGRNGVSIMNADGSGQAERLADSDVELSPNAMAPDGAGIIARTFKTVAADTNLVLVPIGGGDIRPIKASGFSEQNAALSPDGRWLAFQENTSGRLQVTVCPFPNVDDGSWQVSTTGGRDPLWSRDGRELFYVSPDATMMRVAVTTSPSFSHDPPQRLFDASAYEWNIGRNFDLAPDGRFLMVRPYQADDDRPEEVVVVLNWLEDLKARMR